MDSQLDRFYRAWCAPELTLLGFRLRAPFCLGHALLLEALGSPFAALDDPSAAIEPADLLLALRICARAAWPYRRVDLRAGVWTRLRTWWLGRDPDRFQRHVETFCAWIAECSGRPEFWQSDREEQGGGISAPDLLASAVAILRRTTLSEERVWSMPHGLVSWYAGTIAEQEGSDLRFAYDAEFDERHNAPDLSTKTEDELYAQVLADLGPAFADRWRAQRALGAPGSSLASPNGAASLSPGQRPGNPDATEETPCPA